MAISKTSKILGGVGIAMAAAIGGVMLLTGGLQDDINNAQCGQVITVEAGQVYVGPFTLPVKNCTAANPIIIQSSRASELPEGKRVTPAQAPLLAWLQSNTNAEPVIKTAAGAHDYKFIGVRVSTTSASVAAYDLVRWGGGKQDQKTLDVVPRNLTIDRSWIHGWSTQDVQRGVMMNCAECWVTNSYINDIHVIGVEAQAIGAWNTPGPIHIINNYLEAAGENIMIGGADSAAPEFVPSNGEIIHNHLFKPLSWKVGDPSYAGRHWTVKNTLELKSAKDWIIDANLLENNWTDAQTGEILLLTVRNQECTAPWSTVQRVTVTRNIIKNGNGAITFIGLDNEAEAAFGKCPAGSPKNVDGTGSVRGTEVLVANNLFYNINGTFVKMDGFSNVSLRNNTHLQGGNTLLFFGGQVAQGFNYTLNVTQEREYGIRDESGLEGVTALEKWTPAYSFVNNVMATPYTKNPPGNDYPPVLVIDSDFRTPYTGKGADIDVLLAAQAGVTSGPVPTVSPTAPPSVTPTVTVTPTPAPSATATPTVAPLPSPTVTPAPTPQPSPTPSPITPCAATSWPSSVAGQNSQMSTRRAQGCYPVRRTNNGMEYMRP